VNSHGDARLDTAPLAAYWHQGKPGEPSIVPGDYRPSAAFEKEGQLQEEFTLDQDFEIEELESRVAAQTTVQTGSGGSGASGSGSGGSGGSGGAGSGGSGGGSGT
jgi:uncharacterized membrane protein YgcG